jgi:protein-disulfide isomerase
MPTFQSCWNAPETVAAVQEDIASATAVGVDGTPSIYVRGLYGDDWVQVRRPSDIAVLLKMISEGKQLPTPIQRPTDQ